MRRVISAFLCLLMLAGMAACGEDKPNRDSRLNIFYSDYDVNAREFVTNYLKECKTSKGRYFSFGREKELEKALAEGEKSEDMPDVLILPYNLLPKLSRYVEAGTFCDMNALIANDKSFRLSDYNVKILDSGVYDGKRYIMPLNYSVNVLATTGGILEKYNISKDWSALSLKQLTGTAKSFKTSNPSGCLLDMLDFYPLMLCSDKAFIDMKNKKVSFNTDEFESLADSYYGLKDSYLPMTRLLKVSNEQQFSELVKNGEIAMLTRPVTKISDLYKPYMSFDKEVDPIILPVPYNSDKVHISAQPQSFVAISAKCSDKKAAFALVKDILGQQYQESDEAYGLPVNNKAFDSILNKALKDKSCRNAGCKSDAAAKSIIGQFSRIVAAVDRVNDIDFELQVKLQDIVNNAVNSDGEIQNSEDKLQSAFDEYIGRKLAQNASIKAGSSLSVYYMDYKRYMDNAIMTFSSKYQDTKIDAKVFNFDSGNGIEEFRKTLSKEILAGGGPDLVIFNPFDFDSINKIIDSGAFTDLNELISKDGELKLSDYNSKIIGSGIYDGKRLFVPIYYNLPIFYTTESILKQNGIKMKDGCTIKELGAVVDSFLNNKSRKSKYLFDTNMKFTYLMNFSEVKFFDYKSRKSNFDSSDFKELLKLYKKMQPAITPLEVEEKYQSDPIKLWKNNVFAIFIDILGSASQMHAYNCLVEHEFGNSLKVLRITDSSGVNTYRPMIADAGAINNNCKNKDAAFNFIKVMLSEDIQRMVYSDGFSQNGIESPVSNSAFKKDIAKLSGPEGARGSFSDGINAISLPAELAKRFTDINENMAEPDMFDMSIKIIISDALKDYLSGRINEDQTAKLINDKVTLFLNE